MEIKQLADNVFRHPVKGENSISLEFECIENPKDLFETFLELFTEGMKILFGNNGQVDLTSLNKEQFSLIQKYFKSMRITLYYHVFHIKQIENLENSRSNNIEVKYDIINPISDEIIKENFPEMPKPRCRHIELHQQTDGLLRGSRDRRIICRHTRANNRGNTQSLRP